MLHPTIGYMLPTWDFEIAEKPQPGQYRLHSLAFDTNGGKAGSDQIVLAKTEADLLPAK